MEMWKNYGFTSYISGTGKQLIGESVRAVEECLKTQKPKVVILETDQLYTNSNSAQVIARDARKQILNQFSVLEYHDRWKQFDPKTAVKRKSYSARFASKGQFVSGAKVPYRGKEYIKKDQKARPDQSAVCAQAGRAECAVQKERRPADFGAGAVPNHLDLCPPQCGE